MSRGSLDFEGFSEGKYDHYHKAKKPKIERLEPPEQVEARARKLGREAMNCHHLIWMKKDHHDIIRLQPIFQPQMYVPAHNALHRGCPPVPKFNQKLLHIIKAEFEPTNDTFDSLDRLLFLINGANKGVMSGQTKDLCLHALESQIPYLRGNIKPAKGYHK